MTETTALDVVAEAPVKKKEVERGNKVLVTPLYGVKGEQPMCYHVVIDGCNILLDCG